LHQHSYQDLNQHVETDDTIAASPLLPHHFAAHDHYTDEELPIGPERSARFSFDDWKDQLGLRLLLQSSIVNLQSTIPPSTIASLFRRGNGDLA